MPRLPTTFDDPVYDDRALADYTARLPVEMPPQLLGQNAANAVTNLFTDVGNVPRYQTWPEKMIRSGATLPGDVVAGRIPMSLGLRREDYTDIPEELAPSPTWLGKKLGLKEGVDLGPNAELIERTQDLSGMAGSGALGSKPNATLGSGPVIRAAKENLRDVVDSNFNHGRVIGDQTISIDSLKGGVSHDPKNIARVDKLAYEIKSPEGYIERLIVDDVGNVIEGQHRLDALRQNGATEVPVTVIKDLERGFDAKKMKEAAKNAGARGDNAQKVVQDVLEILHDEGGNINKILSEYDLHPAHKAALLASDTSASAPVSALAKSPVFYSAVEKAVKEAKQNTATGEQWLGYLRNQPGVKQEELDWVLHELPKGQISKSDLEQFVKEHKVELKEVEKGGVKYSSDRLVQISNRLNDIQNEQNALGLQNDSAARTEQVAKLNREHDALYAEMKDIQGNPTKYSQWQLPGGSNYREMLLTLPNKPIPPEEFAKQYYHNFVRKGGEPSWEELSHKRQEQLIGITPKALNTGEQFTSSHWSEPNVLAHIRTNERDIPSVGKSLHIEEIQSDWHQKGRNEGYKFRDKKTEDKWNGIEKKIMDSNDESILANPELKDALKTAVDKKIITADEAKFYHDYRISQSTIPDAPFKSNWADLALKRIIRQAAESGHDAISWTPGEAQAARYDLSKQVDYIDYVKRGDNYRLGIVGKNGEGITLPKEHFHKNELADIVGKEIAEKIVNGEGKSGGGRMTLQNIDLKIGGEGMQAFYDKMLVDKANAIAKKFGSKVEQAEVNKMKITANTIFERGNPIEVIKVGNGWHIKYENGETFGSWISKEDAENAMIVQRQMLAEGQPKQSIHVLKLTPALRDAALNKGFSLFADTGKVGAPLTALTKVEGNPFTTTAFHGTGNEFKGKEIKTAPLNQFDTNPKNSEFYSTPNPRLAGDYATVNPNAKAPNILPLRVDTSKYHEVDALGRPWDAVNQFAINEAHQLNKPGVIIRNVLDDANPNKKRRGENTVYITLDPSTVRSKFAKFDPQHFGENGLLKSDTEVGSALSALAKEKKHWFTRTPDDPYVYHGTTVDKLTGIKNEGLQAFLRTYFASDPKIAMQYGYRSNIHHPDRGRGEGGILLRVRKEDVDPEGYKLKRNEDFWTGPSEISPDKIEVKQGSKWRKLTDTLNETSELLKSSSLPIITDKDGNQLDNALKPLKDNKPFRYKLVPVKKNPFEK